MSLLYGVPPPKAINMKAVSILSELFPYLFGQSIIIEAPLTVPAVLECWDIVVRAGSFRPREFCYISFPIRFPCATIFFSSSSTCTRASRKRRWSSWYHVTERIQCKMSTHILNIILTDMYKYGSAFVLKCFFPLFWGEWCEIVLSILILWPDLKTPLATRKLWTWCKSLTCLFYTPVHTVA